MTSSADRAAKSLADPARWRLAGDPQALEKARIEMINIVQWLARVANSYVTARTPDDRVLLGFRAADAAFVTKTFDDGLALEMRLPSLEMQFVENGRAAPHILDPEEHSPAEVEAWLLVELLHRGIDRSKFTKQLPYSVPNLMTGDAEDYSPHSCESGLKALMAWFQNAAEVLEAAAVAQRPVRPASSARRRHLISPASRTLQSEPAELRVFARRRTMPRAIFLQDMRLCGKK